MSKILTIRPTHHIPYLGIATFLGKEYPCTLGQNGLKPAAEKREGDMCTPLGTYRIQCGFFRPDKLTQPKTAGLQLFPSAQGMGWDDTPESPTYNALITENYAGGGEGFWRPDDCYNLVLSIAYNGAWPYPQPKPEEEPAAVAGIGSGIFIHVWRQEDPTLPPTHTAGCVGFKQADLLEIVAQLGAEDEICIQSR